MQMAMEFPFEQELGIDDGAYVERVVGTELIAVLASGPVLPGMPSTAEFVARAFADDPPEDAEHALAVLHRKAREDRLASATAALWSERGLMIAWVGVVRAHLIRGARLVASTHDHTLVHELPSADELAIVAPFDDSPALERIVTRTLGGGGSPGQCTWVVAPGDVLLMCAAHLHDFRPPNTYVDRAQDFARPLAGRLMVQRESALDHYQESMSSRSRALGSKVSPTESS
ncbi:hypothetical protein ENSA5_09830 [Enhygromyxa salina]|uniref:PPM-type phosphatase domain-containing protein n=1 Tax=Enhygromyxa salina TaxID=215803 RepID=A0A2S9YGH4_9BACT|nr:hypothetical protein [Enhygromyxa salina]PRQ04199.1 hypothetical protein ENSA5_09830 [Enhygromyxa salina]